MKETNDMQEEFAKQKEEQNQGENRINFE